MYIFLYIYTVNKRKNKLRFTCVVDFVFNNLYHISTPSKDFSLNVLLSSWKGVSFCRGASYFIIFNNVE